MQWYSHSDVPSHSDVDEVGDDGRKFLLGQQVASKEDRLGAPLGVKPVVRARILRSNEHLDGSVRFP